MDRVLQVVDVLSPRFGVTSVVLNYYNHIDKSEIQFDFLVLEDSDSQLIEKIRNQGGNVFFMPKLDFLSYFKFVRFIKSFFKNNNNYIAIHSHFNQIDFVLFKYAKKFGITKTISHSHNTKLSDYKVRAIRNWLMTRPIKWIAKYHGACSALAGEALYGKNFMNSSKSFIMNNAINLSDFSYNPNKPDKIVKEFNLKNSKIIGTVGSFKIQKNQKYLIKIFSRILVIEPNVMLIIVGDGALKNDLMNLVKELNLEDKVIFTGMRRDVNELLRIFDVFVLTSLYEGLPVIGIEAQATGIPCVFSDTITKEVDLVNVKYCSLEHDDDWIKAIVDSLKIDKIDTTSIIRDKGYDIVTEANKMMRFYKGHI